MWARSKGSARRERYDGPIMGSQVLKGGGKKIKIMVGEFGCPVDSKNSKKYAYNTGLHYRKKKKRGGDGRPAIST